MIAFVTGGARSGKSAVGEQLAVRAAGPDGQVTYLATIWPSPGDENLAERLATHRLRRPASWATVEPPYDLPTVLAELEGVVLLDSLGSWLSAQPGMDVDPGSVTESLQRRSGDTIVVTDEVGWGVHPATEVGRHFRDALGRLNQSVAAVADEALLVVAGRVLRLDEP